MLHNKKAKFVSLDIEKIVSYSNDKVGNNWDVYIYGGEPLIHPQLFDLLDRLKDKPRVVIQTNLSAGINYIKRIANAYPNVVFFASYHYTYSDFTKFVKKVKAIIELGKFGEIAVMWVSKFDKEIVSQFNLMKKLFKNVKVHLTPVFPGKTDAIGWVQKSEINRFLEKYSPYITTFDEEVDIDNIRMTSLEAYRKNIDLYFYGTTCYLDRDWRISYNGTLNEWTKCSADLAYGTVNHSDKCIHQFGCVDLACNRTM